jgi:hypothetical protein
MKTQARLVALAVVVFALAMTAFARNSNKNEGNFTIQNKVRVGSTDLQPGTYKAQWKEATDGAVKIDILQHGKTIATVDGKLKSLQEPAPYDAVITKPLGDNTSTIDEIDFGRRNQALVLGGE